MSTHTREELSHCLLVRRTLDLEDTQLSVRSTFFFKYIRLLDKHIFQLSHFFPTTFHVPFEFI